MKYGLTALPSVCHELLQFITYELRKAYTALEGLQNATATAICVAIWGAKAHNMHLAGLVFSPKNARNGQKFLVSSLRMHARLHARENCSTLKSEMHSTQRLQ
eukprot:6192255-Pleurochrysis_carterae.AAC.1